MRGRTRGTHPEMKPTAKRSPGRPTKPESAKFDIVSVRLPKALVQDIEDYCAGRRDAPDRSTAIRELLVKALTA